MGNQNDETIVYERFCRAYFDYANAKRIEESDPMWHIIDCITTFSENKSLVPLFKVVDARSIQADEAFEVPFKTFIQKIQRHHGRSWPLDAKQQSRLEDLIVKNKSTGMADLCLLQELIGFEE